MDTHKLFPTAAFWHAYLCCCVCSTLQDVHARIGWRFVVGCDTFVPVLCIHNFQSYLADIGTITRLFRCLWSNPRDYMWIFHMNAKNEYNHYIANHKKTAFPCFSTCYIDISSSSLNSFCKPDIRSGIVCSDPPFNNLAPLWLRWINLNPSMGECLHPL